jgi:hypothetical protein
MKLVKPFGLFGSQDLIVAVGLYRPVCFFLSMFLNVATSRLIVHPPDDMLMSMESDGGMILTGETE